MMMDMTITTMGRAIAIVVGELWLGELSGGVSDGGREPALHERSDARQAVDVAGDALSEQASAEVVGEVVAVAV